MTDEEWLSASLDRELDPSRQADVTATSARDPETAARITRLRANDDLLRTAFDAPMHEGTPDRFTAAIDAGLTARRHPSSPAVNDNRPRWWHFGGAVAASLALGLVIGTQFVPRGGAATTSVALSDALDATPSLHSVALASGERVIPELTVAQNGGGFCRQFRLATHARDLSGVACRSGRYWTVEALLPAAPAGTARDGYVTAEGPKPSGVSQLIDRRRDGDPLDAAAEQALIARDWR